MNDRFKGFWGTLRWLRTSRADQDAYCARVFESKGFTPVEARRATIEVRLATRGIPHTPWFHERWAKAKDREPGACEPEAVPAPEGKA